MAEGLDHWKKRLDDEFGQITRRFDEIHERFDKVAHAQAGDDISKLLKDLQKRVKKVRTGGWFRPGAHQYNRVLKKYNEAKSADAAGTGKPAPQQFGR